MKNKHLWFVMQIGLVVLAVGLGALAQNSPRQTFRGAINAYSPQTTSATGTTGPYEVRGPWSLTLKGNTGKADFSAAVNMEESDGWVITENGGNFDPAERGAHTHHITVTDAVVTQITNGFEVSGTATITLNGSPAPVSPSPLVIDVTGGTTVRFSNITLTFGAPASGHFGTEPLAGIVRSVEKQK
jgi:hypothetical protein